MIARSKIPYNEPKSIPKQIPLFEEQDDGNLIPYEKDE
jgi:hypothetical protein